ncbi:MAG: methyltransferase domain-containing protein [Ruminococcus sp.]|nr:methyltransferase domain-containing protein [Ruminococcus sp.]
MCSDLIPFWEKAYREDDVNAFSDRPNATVTEFEPLINHPSSVLDVGCGEGQNAVYLARQGHRVDAFDLSEHGIAKLKRRCESFNVHVNAFTANLTAYQFERCYDMVICFGTLHFVAENEWKKFINHAKEYTNTGGIHIIQIFTDTVPASDDIAPFAVGLSKDGELKKMYSDWEILQFKSYVFEDEHPNVPKHLHASNKIVAKKIK